MAQIQVQPPAAVSAPAPAEDQTTGGGGAAAIIPATSLYVGDLDLNVVEGQLYDLFCQAGPVVSVRVCRDVSSKKSLGYAYVNFKNPEDATKAIEMLNFTPVNGRPMRVMVSNRDPTSRKSSAANLFIKNLDKSIDNKALYDLFSSFGQIVSSKVATDLSGQSKGYGFVQFENEESAQNAINKLNGMLLNDKKVFVGPFLSKQERESNTTNPTENSSVAKFNNVFVKNLSESTSEEDLKEVFGKFGEITSVIVMREGDGKSKCFGFVNFENADSAIRAVEELNGKKFGEKEWYVGRAMKKSEREMELRERFMRSLPEPVVDRNGQSQSQVQGANNLYIKHLDDSIGDDDKLRELFSGFGTITSCKIMRDTNGVSKGAGFVAFQSPEDASRAIAEMNGKMIGSKPLYVAVAQRKDERRASLQAQYAQMRPVVMPPAMAAPPVAMYPMAVPGQQLFYGQRPFVGPQGGYGGFQQPLIAGGMRAGPIPNFVMPHVVPPSGGPQGLRPRRPYAASNSMQQSPYHSSQHQFMPRGGRGNRFSHGRGMMYGRDFNGGGGSGSPQSVPISMLASALANSSPEQQRVMLGESLYPLVEEIEHDQAAKVTGMLLEMDRTEVLHLLESPDALKLKVAEAMDVLRNAANLTTNQLAALSLNEGIAS